MGSAQQLIDKGGFAMDRKSSRPVPKGEYPYALRPLGLWDTEIGEFKGLFKACEPAPLPQISLIHYIHNRAKLVNQNYFWPWRGTIADLVCLAALNKYDRLGLLTIFHTHDIPEDHFLWFRSRGVRTHCCEPMDVLPYTPFPTLSTYCGDIIFEVQKDCTPMPDAWLNSNDWTKLEPSFGAVTQDLAALGFSTIKQAGWWLRLKHTWRFNSWRLLGELVLSCNGLTLHPRNQCPDFYNCPDIWNWILSYSQNEQSQELLVRDFLQYKNNGELSQLQPLAYHVPYVEGSFFVGGAK